jgi:hypothetical protein
LTTSKPLNTKEATMAPTNTTTDDAWLTGFDAALRKHFAIDHEDAGMDSAALDRYRDHEPIAAALQFGADYDLERVDAAWCG